MKATILKLKKRILKLEGKLFKFGDGVKPVKVGDTVWEVCADNRRMTAGQKFIVAVGTKLITVSHTMNNPNNWNNTQYYLETGSVKSDYSTGLQLYTSEKAYLRTLEEQKTLDKCARLFGAYTAPNTLTYDKACRIIKIMEET